MFEIIELFTGIFGVVLFVLYAFITCIITAWIAYEKGYSVGFWVLMGLFFGIIALLGIGFAPNKRELYIINEIHNLLKKQENQNAPGNTPITQGRPNGVKPKIEGEKWICKKCGQKNSLDANSCKGCGDYR